MQKKNQPESSLNSDGASSASTESPSAYVPQSISDKKAILDSHDKFKAIVNKTLVDNVLKDLSANTSPAYKEKYLKTLEDKGYDKDQLEHIASFAKPKTAEQNLQQGATQEPSEIDSKDNAQLGENVVQSPNSEQDNSIVGKATNIIPDYVEKQYEGIKAGVKQGAKGLREIKKGAEFHNLDYRKSLEDIGAGALDAAVGVGKGYLSGLGLINPGVIAFNATTEGVQALPETAKSAIASTVIPDSQNMSDKELSEKFDKAINVPMAAIHAVAEGVFGSNPESGSVKDNLYTIGDLLTFGYAAHKIASGGETKIKDTKSLLSTINKITKGEATPLEVQDFWDYSKSMQGVTVEDIHDLAESKGETEVANKIKEANKIPNEDNHQQIVDLQKEIANTPNDSPLKQGLYKTMQDLAGEMVNKSNLSITKHTRDAHLNGTVADLDAKIEDAKGAMEGKPEIVKQSYQKTIDDLQNKKEELTKNQTEDGTVQIKSPGGLLQLEQTGTGETGGGREGVERGIQGVETTQEGETVPETQTTQEEQVQQEGNKTGVDGKEIKNKRDHEDFKYTDEVSFDGLGNKVKSKRLKTEQELKDSTDKINKAISNAEKEIERLKKEASAPTNETGDVSTNADTNIEKPIAISTPKIETVDVEKPTVVDMESDNQKSFKELSESSIPNSGELGKYLSGETIEQEHGEKPLNDQTYVAMQLEPALQHGVKIVEAAKEKFGEDYVPKMLEHIENGNNKVDEKALMYVSLENDLINRKLTEPENELEIQKLQDLVREKSQAFARSASNAINYGRLRHFAETRFDINSETRKALSSKENEGKRKVEKALQSNADDINEAAHDIEVENEHKKNNKGKADKIREGNKKRVGKKYDAPFESAKRDMVAAKVADGLENGDSIEKTIGDLVDKGEIKEKNKQAAIDYFKDIEDEPTKITHKLVREAVEAGNEHIDDIVKYIKGKDAFSSMTERAIRDEITNYGKEVKTNDEPIEVIIRKAKRIGLLLTKLEVVRKELKRPAKTGLQRDKIQDEERQLQKELNEAMKDLPVDEKQKENQLASSQDRIKTYLENRIKDLKRQIANKEKDVPTKSVEYNESNKILKQHVDELSKELKNIVGDSKVSKEIKIQNAIKAVEKSLAEYERRIKENELTVPEKEKLSSPELEAARESRDKAKAEFEQLKKDALPKKSDLEKLVEKAQRFTDEINNEVGKKLPLKDIEQLERERALTENQIHNLINTLEDSLPKEKKEPKTAKEKLISAKENIKDRINKIRDEIIAKKREIKEKGSKLQPDVELTRLQAEEKAISSLRDKYIPKEKDAHLDEKAMKKIANNILADIEKINKQIGEGERAERETKRDPYKSDYLTKLKAEKKARLDLLEDLDPTPKKFVKDALIKKGFGREITVTTKEGKEKRQIIDWKKLAGEHGSIDKIKANVEQVLRGNGYSEGDILRMQDAFEKEYKDLRASVVEKSLNELQKGNTPKEKVDTKSTAKRLSELYDYGLFDKEHDTYDYLMNKAVGMSGLSQKAFFDIKDLAKSLSELYSTKVGDRKVSEFGMKPAVNIINDKIHTVLANVAFKEGNGFFKATQLVQEFMNLSQRAMLSTPKQLLENPITGYVQRAYTRAGFSFDKMDTKALRKNRKEIAHAMYEDNVRHGGLVYGDISSPLLSKSKFEDWLNKKSDSEVYHTIVSGIMARSYLDAADSMHKTALTEKMFQYNLIKVLTEKGMSKEAAVNYVSENLTGQKFSDALTTAKDIIDKVNKEKDNKVLPDNKEAVNRLATNIVKDALVEGNKLSLEEIEASYKAAYKAAGYDLGHEPNNPLSKSVSLLSSHISGEVNKAIKEKKYTEAGFLTLTSILNRNILNPFVGGGTNWVVLSLQKAALDPVSPLWNYASKKSNVLDLTTDSGMKNMEKAMTANLKSKQTNIRFVAGAMGALITYAAAKSTGADRGINDWLKKNDWAKKYFNVLAPPALLMMIAKENKDLADYFANSLNMKYDNFGLGKKVIQGIKYGTSDKPKDEGKGAGKFGEVIGSNISTPIIPWRFAKETQNIYRGLKGQPKIKVDYTSQGFFNGAFQNGFADYIGLRPGKTK